MRRCADNGHRARHGRREGRPGSRACRHCQHMVEMAKELCSLGYEGGYDAVRRYAKSFDFGDAMFLASTEVDMAKIDKLVKFVKPRDQPVGRWQVFHHAHGALTETNAVSDQLVRPSGKFAAKPFDASNSRPHFGRCWTRSPVGKGKRRRNSSRRLRRSAGDQRPYPELCLDPAHHMRALSARQTTTLGIHEQRSLTHVHFVKTPRYRNPV